MVFCPTNATAKPDLNSAMASKCNPLISQNINM
jgi:hypothetical protein